MNYRTTIALIIILGLVIGISIVYTTNRSSEPDRVSVPSVFFWSVDDDAITKLAVNYQGQGTSFVTDSKGEWHFNSPDGEPLDLARWGGITLLASGPQYRRVIAETAADLARFGLDSPSTIINVRLGKWRSASPQSDLPLDRFVADSFKLTPSDIEELFQEGNIRVNGGPGKPSEKLTPGDVVGVLIVQGEAEVRLGDRTADGASHYSQYLPPSALKGSGPPEEGVYLVDASWGDQFSRLVTEPPRIAPTPEGAAPAEPLEEGS